jgi:hypothetical protein
MHSPRSDGETCFVSKGERKTVHREQDDSLVS